MATETVASDHTSATDEQIVNKEKSEAIAQKIASLANDDEVKHEKPEDTQGQATPSSETEGKAEGYEKKIELEKSDDSPVEEASAEGNQKHDKVEDAQIPAAHFSKTEGEAEGDDKKAEPAVVAVEKTDDSVSSEANAADSLKEKELIPDSQATSVTEPAHDAAKSQPEEPPSTETTVNETPQQLEKEPIKTEEEKQPKTVDIPEASVETTEKSSNITEANPPTESAAKVVEDAEILETSDQKEEKPEPVATEVLEKTKEPKKESQEEPQEAEQPSTVTIPEPSTEANEKPSDAIEEKTRGPSSEVLKETNHYDAGPTETVKAEPVVTDGEEIPKEPEKQSFDQKEEEQPNTAAIPEVPSSETSEAVEDKKREPELDAEVLKETKKYEAGPTETKKAEPVVTKVYENPSEPEKQTSKQEEGEQPKTGIPETTAERAEKEGDTVEVHPSKESDIEGVKDIGNSEVVPGKAEKPDDRVVVHPPKESDIEGVKETGTSESEALPEKAEKADDIIVVHPPKESDIEGVKETGTSESEAVPEKAEKPDDIVAVHPPKESDVEVVKDAGNSESEAVAGKEVTPELVSTKVEEKPRELLEVAEKVGETNSKDQEIKQEIVFETTKIEGTSDDTVKDPIQLKEEKTDKEEETSITANTAQVSLNEETQAAPENLVELSPQVAEKVVGEDGKKESSFTDEIERVSKDVAGVIKNPEQASNEHEAKTGLKEEREYSVPTTVEEKVVVAANDDKKEPEAPEAVQVSSREADVEIKKDEELNETKTATTEARDVKAKSVIDDRPAVDKEKEGQADTKVDEISSAVSEPVRETLASKFEEEESTKTGVDNLEKEQTEEPVKTEVQAPEPPTKESDATKTSSKDLPKETPAKPAQKQSNNIISKVKQSLVKAKKAITGKSPSSKNHSSEAKDDIKVK